jgi:hypothetical protein
MHAADEKKPYLSKPLYDFHWQTQQWRDRRRFLEAFPLQAGEMQSPCCQPTMVSSFFGLLIPSHLHHQFLPTKRMKRQGAPSEAPR